MRGRTGAWLVQGVNQRTYVAKWAQPGSVRGLISEMYAGTLLSHLQIRTPPITILDVTDGVLLERSDYLRIRGIADRARLHPGCHYGSLVEPDLERQAVYDILPTALYRTLDNRMDFVATLLVDKLLNNRDYRQAVFYRQQRGRRQLVAEMIDHGMCLGGDDWVFEDAPLWGIHVNPAAYDEVLGWSQLEPLLEEIRELPPALLESVRERVPAEWLLIEGGLAGSELDRVADLIMARRTKVRSLIQAVLDLPDQTIFRNWGCASPIEYPIKKDCTRAAANPGRLSASSGAGD
ncbi:MAG: hypothetical protein JNK87_25750 [Bryobacterales bacterium]|nr:hypothetical protein [Bryobacterales bacterium]